MVTKVALRNCCRCSFSSPVWQLFFKDRFWAAGVVFQKTKRGFCSACIVSQKPPSFFPNTFFTRSYDLCPKTYFSASTEQGTVTCLKRVFQGQILNSWRNVFKNQERFLFWTTWATKTSFSFVKCVMDEEIKALSHVPFSGILNLKTRKHVP